jgi:hypothetical protein
MVLTLNLNLIKAQNQSFQDVPPSSWEFKYVETAKYYLTGWRTSTGDLFMPSIPAVREDMAVALVNALNFSNEQPDDTMLDVFVDKNEISPNLKKYAALAVKHNIMQGSPYGNGSLRSFNPQSSLTRAEAATLLYRILTNNAQKITYDKPTNADISQPYVSSTTNTPTVTGIVNSNNIVLNWNATSPDNFVYYKIVISKNNSSPKYPDDGYLYYITDPNLTTATIDNTKTYNGGDFGGKLTPGQEYYFSITAVYNNIKIPSNTIRLKYP